jgi:hypothetical protein
VRKPASSAAVLEYVEDGVEDLAGVVESRVTSSLEEMWLKARPFAIAEVGKVCCSHAR